jgi:hypothetical protein
MPQKKKQLPKKEFAKNKHAFDGVLKHVRLLGRPWLSPSHAVNPESVSGGSRNPAKPNPVEFWSDVFLAVKATCPKDITLVRFFLAYVLGDADVEDDIMRELHAQKSLGDRRHSVEQRVGAEFLRRGIHPVMGKGYFWAPRRHANEAPRSRR